MRQIITILCVIFIFSCSSPPKDKTYNTINWNTKNIKLDSIDNLFRGNSYLSVYSEIYDLTEESTHLLTATVSIRNTSEKDSLFLTRADYYNTSGELIRSYIENPVFLTPLETVEIVIHRRDTTGGTGANFIFNWAIPDEKYEPLFESVMIWTTGNQGISFATKGINYRD